MEDLPGFITFVLGAGSSFEVRMPTGGDLKGKIASCLAFKTDEFRRLAGGDDQVREAIYSLGQRRDSSHSVNDYYTAARRIVAGMPQAPSIDNFIDSHRSNISIATVGKLAIASTILNAEQKSLLYVNPENTYNRLDFGRISETWFNAFFQLLCLNAQEDDLPARLSRVRVITFNYDRTLEHFLYHSFQNYYGSSAEHAAKIVSHLTVLHPYGQVGRLPWQEGGVGVPYGAIIGSDALLQVSATLRTFTEGTSEAVSDILKVRESISDARIIVFLGFAFHELNMKLLFGPPSEHLTPSSGQVFGTAMGLSESNKKAIANELTALGGFMAENVILRRELTAAQLLPEYSRYLRVPGAA